MEHLARVWTAGAIHHIDLALVEDPLQFLKEYQGRKIATLVDENAMPLNDFQFQKNDLILLGSEKNGLDENVVPLMDQSLYLPSLGHTSCLNVAVTFGIVMNQAMQSI